MMHLTRSSLALRALSVSLLFSLAGCGSMEKNAQEKLENGEFQSSLEIYDKILNRDPNNGEALEGRKRARAGVLGEMLIGVRKARDSGNTNVALDNLLAVSNQERTWNQFPSAAAKFTQEEETGFAWKPFHARITSELAAKQPLLADFHWKRFGPIFTGSKNAGGYAALGPQIARSGKDHCSALSREASTDEPYYSSFVTRYCRYWKVDGKRVAGLDRARTSGLISGLSVKGSPEGMPREYVGILTGDFEDALKQSAWYDPSGAKKIDLQMSGGYNFNHVKNLVSRVHEYQADESYQTIEAVTKTRQVPVQLEKYETDAKTGLVKKVAYTEMRAENYTENENVTKHRNVARQFPYSALFHQQQIELNSAVIAQVGNQSFTLTESAKAAAEGDEQNIKNDEIGLKPMKPTLLDPGSWVKGESSKLKAQFAAKLKDEWIAQNCSTSSSAGAISELGDRALKCKREPSAANLPFVESWYTKTFGLGQGDVEVLLAERK